MTAAIVIASVVAAVCGLALAVDLLTRRCRFDGLFGIGPDGGYR